MRRVVLGLTSAFTVFSLSACGNFLFGDGAKGSYAVGVALGQDLKRNLPGGADLAQLAKGLKEKLAGKTSQSDQQVMQALQAFVAGRQANPQAPADANASYAIGVDVGRSIGQSFGDSIKTSYLLAGLKDRWADKAKVTDEAAQKELMAFGQRHQAEKSKDQAKGGEANQKAGDAFLAANKAKPGVKVTASGLQYIVVKEGTGPKPSPTSMVSVHYAGTLIDGTEFDSSIKRGQPVSFPVNGVIPGWQEALQLMSKGAKFQLFIPGNLAYGATGAGDKIGPNALLIFDVELLEIKKK